MQPAARLGNIISEISELTAIPGNIGLSENRKAARVREIFRRYHDRIEAELDRRRAERRPSALIAIHSFTPVFKGVERPWHAGVLYNRDPRFAQILITLLQREAGLVIGDNEPYSVTDASDYTIPVHGEQRGLLHVAIEVRQDLIIEDAGQRAWSALLARFAIARVRGATPGWYSCDFASERFTWLDGRSAPCLFPSNRPAPR